MNAFLLTLLTAVLVYLSPFDFSFTFNSEAFKSGLFTSFFGTLISLTDVLCESLGNVFSLFYFPFFLLLSSSDPGTKSFCDKDYFRFDNLALLIGSIDTMSLCLMSYFSTSTSFLISLSLMLSNSFALMILYSYCTYLSCAIFNSLTFTANYFFSLLSLRYFALS